MASTEAQRAWVNRVLLGRTQDPDQSSPDLVSLKVESQTIRSSSQVSNEEFQKICKLFSRLSTMVEGAAVAGSLLKLSELNTKGSSSSGEKQAATPADLAVLGRLFQKTFADAVAAAPSASLSKLSQLGQRTSENSSQQPLATQAQLADIEQGLKEARSASTIEFNGLLALADLRRAS